VAVLDHDHVEGVLGGHKQETVAQRGVVVDHDHDLSGRSVWVVSTSRLSIRASSRSSV
jgi:hypothetical protein